MKKLGLVLKSLIFSLFLISAPFVFAEEKASTLPENSTAVAENDSSAEKTEPKEDVKPEEESELKKNKKQLKKDKNEKDTQKEEEKENKTVINIENARNTKYEKDKETGNDVIILTGDVKISVTKGSTKNVIGADSVRYDRTSEMIYAEGNVSLEQTTETSGSQTVSASSLMFNTSTLEGIFDDSRVVQTKSDALNLPGGSTLIVASDIFGRSESNTITFKDGELTFCNDEDPHWRIKANRIWLLPGGEFAFLNARVFVGPCPVLYLPYFYYPKDELIFNPVFGFEKKRGYFMQTTAYLYGRKPLSTSTTTTSSSDSDTTEKLKALFNFVKPSVLKEQKIEGIMLHNLDKDYKGDTSKYFKIMGDYYTNLGVMAGMEGVFKPSKFFSDISFNTRLGFSNTVFKETDSGEYLPYAPSGNKIYDKSNFMGISLPFRYSGEFKTSLTSPFSLSLSMPIYSDPFFTDDFGTREETMDWVSFLINQSQTDDEETKTTNEVSSFNWNLSGSYSVPLPSIVKPYISTLSLSINSSLVFSTLTVDKDNLTNDSLARQYDTSTGLPLYDTTTGEPLYDETELTDWQTYTPERKFYYPSQITPITLNATLSGTLLDFSSSKKQSKKTETPSFVTPLAAPEEFMTEAEKAKKIEELAKKEAEKNGEDKKTESEKEKDKAEEKESKEKFNISLLPILNGVSGSSTDIPGTAFSMKYSIKPYLTTQVNYSSSNLATADDFDWNEIKSTMYTFKMPITVDNNFSYGGSFFTVSNSYTYSPVWQKHPYIHENETYVEYDKTNKKLVEKTETAWYSETEARNLRKTDYAAEKQDLTNTNTVSLKPFSFIPVIKDTGITWRTNIKMIRTEFLADANEFEKKVYEKYGETYDKSDWIYHWIDWDDKECITTNALDFTFATNQMDSKFTQSFTLTTTLKPLDESYYGTLKFGFPLTTYQIETGVKKVTTTETKTDGSSEETYDWQKQPLKQSLTVSGKVLGSSMSASASYNFNMEDENPDALKLSFSWYGLTAAYQMSYTKGYDFYTDAEVKKGATDDTGATVTESGWHQRSEEEFLPYNFSISYSPGTKTFYRWKNRINLGVGLNTSIVANLLKPTESYFTFAPNLSLKIHEFFTMNLTANIKNSVIYRYFGNEYELSGETNVFQDLLNSFRFDDDTYREASGFKLKSLNLTMTHELHDWDFNATFKVEPRLITEDGKKKYDFNPYITISIVWRPVSAMKTEIVDKYGEWQLK